MCFAIPGKITSVDGTTATVTYPTETCTARIVAGDYAVGDYVIVQAKIVIEKVPERQAIAWNEYVEEEKRKVS